MSDNNEKKVISDTAKKLLSKSCWKWAPSLPAVHPSVHPKFSFSSHSCLASDFPRVVYFLFHDLSFNQSLLIDKVKLTYFHLCLTFAAHCSYHFSLSFNSDSVWRPNEGTWLMCHWAHRLNRKVLSDKFSLFLFNSLAMRQWQQMRTLIRCHAAEKYHQEIEIEWERHRCAPLVIMKMSYKFFFF